MSRDNTLRALAIAARDADAVFKEIDPRGHPTEWGVAAVAAHVAREDLTEAIDPVELLGMLDKLEVHDSLCYLVASLHPMPTAHVWPCEHAPGGAGACVDSNCPAYVAP